MIEVDGPAACIDQSSGRRRRGRQAHGSDRAAPRRVGRRGRCTLEDPQGALAGAAPHRPKKINEDVVVPVSRMGELIEGWSGCRARAAYGSSTFGHAGNGNIHVNLLIDPDDAAAVESAHLPGRGLRSCCELGGTLSGEHGVGIAKRDFVDREIDARCSS
jgi:D-lactate dehydrogenase (quinone)